jgi:predicted DCC family thiol-disulfide oxidoreductase YuxK
MRKLYILYDAECAVCARCLIWLNRQPAFVPLVFIPLQSPEAGRRFPGIEQMRPDKELIAISDAGDVWQGGSAWVMCLWALREYREWSQRLAHPALLPLARRACAVISENRHRISRWLFHSSAGPDELQRRLNAIPIPKCLSERCPAPPAGPPPLPTGSPAA